MLYYQWNNWNWSNSKLVLLLFLLMSRLELWRLCQSFVLILISTNFIVINSYCLLKYPVIWIVISLYIFQTYWISLFTEINLFLIDFSEKIQPYFISVLCSLDACECMQPLGAIVTSIIIDAFSIALMPRQFNSYSADRFHSKYLFIMITNIDFIL